MALRAPWRHAWQSPNAWSLLDINRQTLGPDYNNLVRLMRPRVFATVCGYPSPQFLFSRPGQWFLLVHEAGARALVFWQDQHYAQPLVIVVDVPRMDSPASCKMMLNTQMGQWSHAVSRLLAASPHAPSDPVVLLQRVCASFVSKAILAERTRHGLLQLFSVATPSEPWTLGMNDLTQAPYFCPVHKTPRTHAIPAPDHSLDLLGPYRVLVQWSSNAFGPALEAKTTLPLDGVFSHHAMLRLRRALSSPCSTL